MIIIVSTANDSAVSSVMAALEKKSRRDVMWLNLETAFTDVSFQSQVGPKGLSWSIQSRKHPELVATPENITAVYWRRPVSYLGSPFMGIPTSKNLDAVEIFWSIRWHLEALPAKLFPLGHPWSFARAENKHRQMETAVKLGFSVPATLHSNQPQLLEEFARNHSEVALKALRMPAVSLDGDVMKARHIHCKSFSGQKLADRLSTVDQCQLYCQETISRPADWRITILPHRVICAEINVSSLPEDVLDWRQFTENLPHRIIPVDSAFEAKLRAFLREMDIPAGYFDFAAPASGPPIFFECNTNAQWLWLEQITGYGYGEAIAEELCR